MKGGRSYEKKLIALMITVAVAAGVALAGFAYRGFVSETQVKKDVHVLEKLIKEVSKKMQKAAAELNSEAAAELRDKMVQLKKMYEETFK